jgi:hypothetical protein
MATRHSVQIPTSTRADRATTALSITVGTAAWASAALTITVQAAGATHLRLPDYAVTLCWTLAAALLGTAIGLLRDGDSRLMDLWALGIQLGDPDLDHVLTPRGPDWRARPAVRWIASHVGTAAWVLAGVFTWRIVTGRLMAIQLPLLGFFLTLGVACAAVSVIGRKHARIATAIDMACLAHQQLREPLHAAAVAAHYESEETGPPHLRVVEDSARAGQPRSASGE